MRYKNSFLAVVDLIFELIRSAFYNKKILYLLVPPLYDSKFPSKPDF